MANQDSTNNQEHAERPEFPARQGAHNDSEGYEANRGPTDDSTDDDFQIWVKGRIKAFTSGWITVSTFEKRFELVLGMIGVAAALSAALIYGCQLHAFNMATNTATETRVLTDLPFINPSSFKITSDKDSNGAPVFRVVQMWQNLGTSRASEIVIQWGWSDVLPTENTPTKTITNFSRYTLLKGETAKDEIEIPESNSELKRAESNHVLYTFGVIRYRDVFPPLHDQHIVKYCVEFDRLFLDGVEAYDHPCEKGNCYDKECSNP